MSEHNTPEARAEKVYPMDHYTHQVQREAYAAALRDDAARDERTSENAKLRALVQRFVNHNAKWVGRGCLDADIEWDEIIGDCKEHGFVPTNTEDK